MGTAKMENDKGELVDLYVPRKCSATNRIIKAKDHASVQISVGKVDENGRFTVESQVYALCGFVRAMGESDDSLNRLAQRDGLLKNVWSGSSQRNASSRRFDLRISGWDVLALEGFAPGRRNGLEAFAEIVTLLV